MASSPPLPISLSPYPYRHENDLSCSPDPLATPACTPVKSSSPGKKRNSTIITTPSPRKRRGATTKVLEEITFSSPRRRKASKTPSCIEVSPSRAQAERVLSPWKIRITVEAEPEDAGRGGVGNKTRSKDIPSREGSSPSKPSKGKARSRSGSRQSSGKKKEITDSLGGIDRGETATNLRRLIDLDTGFLDENVETDDMLECEPRTRSLNKVHIFPEQGFEAEEPQQDHMEMTGLSIDNNTSREGRHDPISSGLQAREAPQLRELDLNCVSFRHRNGRPKNTMETVNEKVDTHHAPGEENGSSVATPVMYPPANMPIQDEDEAPTATTDGPDGPTEFDTILESEGFTMIDLESVPSARQYVTSPSGVGQEGKELQPDESGKKATASPCVKPIVSSGTPPRQLHDPPRTHIPSYLVLPEGESDISSTVPSSPPLDDVEHNSLSNSNHFRWAALHLPQTPNAFPRLSPKLPSPPRQPSLIEDVRRDGSAKSTPPPPVRVARAGSVLQGLLSPRTEVPRLGPSPMEDSVDGGKGDASTKKQWFEEASSAIEFAPSEKRKAESYSGERRLDRSGLKSPPNAEPAPDSSLMEHQQAVPGDESIRQDTAGCGDSQIIATPTLEGKREMALRDGRKIERSPMPFDPNMSCGSIYYLNSVGRERRWQLEREAISRQIENANSSQVIVIDSDDEEDESAGGRLAAPGAQFNPTASVDSEVDEDICPAEAGQAQNPSHDAEEEAFSLAEQLRQRERAREAVSKPRRDPIPSPWKRGQDIESSFTINNDDTSSIFWQHQAAKLDSSSISCNFEGSAVQTTDGDAGTDAIENVPSPQEKPDSVAPTATIKSSKMTTSFFDEAAERSNSEVSHEPSLPPRPMRIAVNFNDTSDLESRPEVGVEEDNTQLRTPPSSPCRLLLNTPPRSAMKGSRAGLYGLQGDSRSPTKPKVAFSRHSMWLDKGGVEGSRRVPEASLSPEPRLAVETSGDEEIPRSNVVQGGGCEALSCPADEDFMVESEVVLAHKPTLSPAPAPAPASAPVQAASASWFARLTGRVGNASNKDSAAPTKEAAAQPPSSLPSPVGSSNNEMNIAPVAEEAAIPITQPGATDSLPAIPQPTTTTTATTDPRLPPPLSNLSTSGYFSDNHYKHLHILYLKSLKPTFTRPDSIRLGLRACIGQKRYSGDSEFSWEITRRDVEVVERWMRGVEGRDARDTRRDDDDDNRKGEIRKIGWDEADLCSRLFSIVAGQEVRRDLGVGRAK